MKPKILSATVLIIALLATTFAFVPEAYGANIAITIQVWDDDHSGTFSAGPFHGFEMPANLEVWTGWIDGTGTVTLDGGTKKTVRAPISVPRSGHADGWMGFHSWEVVSSSGANVKIKGRQVDIEVSFEPASVSLVAHYGDTSMGPAMDNLYMKTYYSPVAEWSDLKARQIDLMDWALSKNQYNEWLSWPLLPGTTNTRTDPVTGTSITVEETKDLGMFEFDLNNNGTVDGLPGALHTQPGEPNPMSDVNFRGAVARLVDKVSIAKEDFGGLLEVMDVPNPSPVQEVFINSTTVAEWRTGALSYSVSGAQAALDAAGYYMLASGIRRNPATNLELKPLIMYSRLDKPDRAAAGRRFRDALVSVGIPVDYYEVDKSTVETQVMGLFGYHIYTGGWSLDRAPDHLHDFYTGEFANPYDYNYMIHNANYIVSDGRPVIKDAALEADLDLAKYAPTRTQLIYGVKKVQGELFGSKGTIPSIILGHYTPLYTAHIYGWTGIVNQEGTGVRSWFSKMLASNPGTGATTLRFGMASTVQKLNPVTTGWLWDWEILESMYDSLIGVDPFTLTTDQTSGLAEWWDVSTWSDTSGSGTLLKFRIRDNVKWHGGLNMTADDVKFSIEYHQTQFAWFYSSVMDVKNVSATDFDASKGVGGMVTVYMNKVAYLALHWVGGVPIISKDIWEPRIIGGEQYGVPDAYAYDPTVDDANHNGIIDAKEDGSGPWVFEPIVVYAVNTGVILTANNNYYVSYVGTWDLVEEAFHRRADVNYDAVVDLRDLVMMTRQYSVLPYQAAPTWVDDQYPDMVYSPAPGAPYPTGKEPPIDHWLKCRTTPIPYKAEDINYDNLVDLTDLTTLAKYWGTRSGFETIPPQLVPSTSHVYIDPPLVTPEVGTEFTVNIKISGVVDTDIYGWDVKLNWDPTIIDFVSATEGTYLSNVAPEGTFFSWIRPIPPSRPYAELVAAIIGPWPGATGDGTLASVTFKVLDIGLSKITPEPIMLINSNLQVLSYTKTDGLVDVHSDWLTNPNFYAELKQARVDSRHWSISINGPVITLYAKIKNEAWVPLYVRGRFTGVTPIGARTWDTAITNIAPGDMTGFLTYRLALTKAMTGTYIMQVYALYSYGGYRWFADNHTVRSLTFDVVP